MRNYNSEVVRRKVVRVHSVGACPFPGKHSLRLEWSFQHRAIENGKKIKYWGKFTTTSWKRFRKLIESLPASSRPKVSWKLHDRAGEIGRGDHRIYGAYAISFANRYLWDGTNRTPQAIVFSSMRPVRAGTYWVYNTREISLEEQGVIARYIAAQIPHVRTA